MAAPLALIAALAAGSSTAAAEGPFAIGFSETLLGGPDGGRWALRTRAAGADAVRISFYWSVVATERPAQPRNPTDPAYDFGPIDRAVTSAHREGLDILMTVVGAPPWAEGPVRPPVSRQAPAGTWRPDPEAFGDFAHAVAVRYAGTFPDPARPGFVLGEVDLYSAWNEPNTTAFLTPQYRDGENVSAAIYTRLLNAFGAEVRAVNPDARIATGGTAPSGDPVGERRTPPLEFWRAVLCLTPELERAESCPADEPARFDLLAHHPISSLAPPNVHAERPGDVTAADFGRLGELLGAAEREGTIEPAAGHALLAPEIWWETSPPQPSAVSLRRQARYMQLALFLLWRQGAEGAWFLQVRDSPRERGSHGWAATRPGSTPTAAARSPPCARSAFRSSAPGPPPARFAFGAGRRPPGGCGCRCAAAAKAGGR
ncbi:MAG: hypothetical protein U0R24_07205 [Solirubrobacterales bacterium]